LQKLSVLDGEQAAVLAQCVAIGHSGDVIGDRACTFPIELGVEIPWKQAGLLGKSLEQLADHAPGFAGHPVNAEMAIQVSQEKILQCLLLRAALRAELDQRAARAHLVDRPRRFSRNARLTGGDEIAHQRIHHPPHRLVYQPALGKPRELRPQGIEMTFNERQCLELVEAQ